MLDVTTESVRPQRLAVETHLGGLPPTGVASPRSAPRRSTGGKIGRVLDYATLLVPLILQCALLVIVLWLVLAPGRPPDAAAIKPEPSLAQWQALLEGQARTQQALVERLDQLAKPGPSAPSSDDPRLAKALADLAESLKRPTPASAPSGIGDDLKDIAAQLAQLNRALASPRAAATEVDFVVCFAGKLSPAAEFFESQTAALKAELSKELTGRISAFRVDSDKSIRALLKAGGDVGPGKAGSWRCVLLTDGSLAPPDGSVDIDGKLQSLHVWLVDFDKPAPERDKNFARWLTFSREHAVPIQQTMLSVTEPAVSARRLGQRILGRPMP